MSSSRWFTCLAIGVAVMLGHASSAAPQQRVPKRPRLDGGSDTNSATAYYLHGVSVLPRRPAEAADAFYWAARINPAWAHPPYAQRVALLMADPQRLVQYVQGVRGVITSREVVSIDSLYLRALTLDPLFHRNLDGELLMTMMRSLAEDALRRRGADVDRPTVERWVRTSLMSSRDPEIKGWLAYTEGRFPAALEHYAAAARRARNTAAVHAERARIWALEGTLDSALAEMRTALTEMRAGDDKEPAFVYESKALYEHSIAVIHEKKGDLAAAREAYGRALAEDLAFHPAHARLGFLAYAAGDTTTALNELELAVQLSGDDAALRYSYGVALAFARRLDEAAEQLRKAMALEPHFAAPYFFLAHVRDFQDRRAEALELYRAFVSRASRGAPQLEEAMARIAELSGG